MLSGRLVMCALAVLSLTAATTTSTACGRTAPPAGPPTFTRDVAPILFARCASCHRSGGVAPFPLLTYADAADHVDEIAHQTRERHMPPWLPDPGEFALVGERRLTDREVDVLQRWKTAGAPEGDAADLPAPPVFADGWELGRPDHVITPASPYVIEPGTEDVYRNLVMRTALPADVFVRAVEFKTNGARIHHAVIRVDETSGARARDGEDGQPGFDGMSWHSVQDPGGQFIGWAPGRGPITSPEGMAWRLRRGADLVLEVHVVPSKTRMVVQPTVGLYFSPTPPVRQPVTVRMGSRMIDIPPGEAGYIVTDTYDLPVPIDLLSVYPHAHYLARDMLVTATPPDGRVRTLLHIPRWSFHWQQDYRYTAPIPLPAGTRLTMRYTYDNSAGNPHNPHDPPVRVRVGPRSTDEMAELGLQVLTQSSADAARLVDDFAERDLQQSIAMAERRVAETPDVGEYRLVLGGTYVEAGRFDDAIPHLQAALRLNERSATTYNYLAAALVGKNRLAEALPYFRRAATLAPRDERIHFNVGNVLGRLGRVQEARAAYLKAIAINPEFPDAHVNLAVLLFSQRRIADALAHYQQAVALVPDSAVVHANYGGALAAAGRYDDAMRHTRRALELSPGYPPAVANLQRLQRLGIK